MENCKKEALYAGLLRSLEQKYNAKDRDFSRYHEDPVGFIEEVLGEHITDDVRNLCESVRDNVITIGRSGNAVGKTHAIARLATWFYLVFQDSQVYTAAAPPQANLERLLWGELGGIMAKHPQLFEGHTIKNLHVSRGPQSGIYGVAIPSSGTESERMARFSGKHAPHLLFLCDEADGVPDVVFSAIESCMSGGYTRLVNTFNPRHESGPVYRMEREGRANVVELSAFSHPNVTTGTDQIPGAVTREVTVRRINEWCRPLVPGEAETDSFQLPDFLVGATAVSQSGLVYPPLVAGQYKVLEPAFSYMVLGRYPAQATTQLISREWISAARSRWDAYVAQHGEIPPAGTKAVMGLDVAEFGADANVAAFRYGGYIERLISWGGMDVVSTGDRATDEYRSRKVLRACVDATGVGSGVAPQMRRSGCAASAVKVAASPTERTELGEFERLRDQIWWSCREWLRTDPGAMLPPDEMLLEELATPTYEVRNGKIKIMAKDTMRELLKRSPDRADALCLTFYQPDLLFPGL